MVAIRSGWILLALAAGMVLAFNAGCQKADTSAQQVGADRSASGELAALVAKYHQVDLYEDAGELHLLIESHDGQLEESPPIPFSVAFQRPGSIRVHSLQASIVADDGKLHASAESLNGQVLVQDCPQPLTIKSLLGDPLLAAAARGQVEAVLPQLVLLLEPDPLPALAGKGTPKPLDDAELDGVRCHRVSVGGANGPSVFWIGVEDGLLHKFEFPANDLKARFQVERCELWAEFKGARVSREIAPQAFQFAVPEGAKLLKRLLPPPPNAPAPLLARAPEDFSFVDLDGQAVTRESLRGKVAVLDMWATWCGWCFKGLPNLQEVYQRYQSNDKVVILAVNKDAPAMSDAKVRQAFENAQLTIPVVRDAAQLSDKVFAIQVLPTMVVLGLDGTVQDYHVGYDAELAKTLPEKIEKLLAGENLAEQELATYQKALQEYDEQLQQALVSGEAPNPDEPEVARKPTATE